MKKQLIATLAVMFAAGSAFAGSADQVQAPKTRAQVRAELEQAYKQGEIAATRNTEFVEYTNVASTKARNEATAAAAKQSAPTTAGGN